MSSKQMSYCSLEEAWGFQYADLYKKDDSMLPKMPENNDKPDETVLKDRTLTKISSPIPKTKEITEFYMNKKNEIKITCDDFLNHYLNCSNCKGKINKMLDVKHIENFQNLNDSYMDIFILILTGIFIIFILDCFVRLGRK